MSKTEQKNNYRIYKCVIAKSEKQLIIYYQLGGENTPNFTDITNSLNRGKKLSISELIRVIRFSVAAEYEAIQIYEQIIEATDNDLVKKVVADITNEERLHAGQFLDLLFTLAPDEKAIYEKGEQENRELAKQPEAPKPRNGLLQ